jgi:membrane protein DedA with SNARE-associated domain
MDSEQFGGVLRAVLAFLAGYVPVTTMDDPTKAAIVGGLVAIAVAGWSWWQKRKPAPPAA